MARRKRWIAVCSALLLIGLGALSEHAEAKGLRDAFHADRMTRQEFKKAYLSVRTQQAMNTIIALAVYSLKKHGYEREAKEFEEDWNSRFSTYFLQPGVFDLGDHRPLMRWLARAYNWLVDKLGEGTVKALKLDDLNTLNYALPVVFRPKGDPDSGLPWGMEEYRLHFVPYTKVVTYWVSWGACSGITYVVGGWSWLCKPVASFLRTIAGRYSGKLSDKLYKWANKLDLTGPPLEIH